MDSKRKAPKTIESGNRSSQYSKACTRKIIENKVIRHVKFVKSQAGPKDALLQKLRARIEQRKANDVRSNSHMQEAMKSRQTKAGASKGLAAPGKLRSTTVATSKAEQSSSKDLLWPQRSRR